MTYEALARKWRPQNFDDIVEQPQVTQTLKNAISSGRIHHAYLFCGPRGTGKTTTARILAKALNCESGPTANPCNTCASCQGITHGSNMDVLEIDAASNTGVDDVRELRESARYVPASSRYKVYIIDEVHRLSKPAFDALLKTLEEPPPSVIFIFATTEANEVPPTVRSRTLRFDFRLITHESLRDALARIAKAEGIDIDDDAVAVLASEAAGSLRDGQSLLDQLSGYTGGRITADLVSEALGLVDSAILFELTDAWEAHDPERALAVIKTVSRAGRDLGQFAKQLTEHLKRLLFARALGERFADESLNRETADRYTSTGAGWDENDLLRLLMMTLDVSNRWRRSVHPRLEFELLAMRGARIDRSVDIRKLVTQIQNGGTVAAPAATPPRLGARPAPAPVSRPPSSPPVARPSVRREERAASTSSHSTPSDGSGSSESATPVAPTASVVEGTRLDFAPILEAVCATRPTLQAILGQAELIRTGPGTVDLVVYKGSVFHQKQLAQKPIRDLLHAEIARALGEGLRVSIHVKSDGPPKSAAGVPAATRTSTSPSANGAIANDHNLQEIVRRFDGEIVG